MFELLDAVMESTLTPTERLVLIVIAKRYNWKNKRDATPSHKRIAKDTGLSESSAKRATETLEESGWLIVNRPNPKKKSYKPAIGKNNIVHSEPCLEDNIGHGEPCSDINIGHGEPCEEINIGHSDPCLEDRQETNIGHGEPNMVHSDLLHGSQWTMNREVIEKKKEKKDQGRSADASQPSLASFNKVESIDDLPLMNKYEKDYVRLAKSLGTPVDEVHAHLLDMRNDPW